MTPNALFEDLAERTATARTRALMGDREEARAIFAGVKTDFYRFEDLLRDVPGMWALRHSVEATDAVLTDTEGRMP